MGTRAEELSTTPEDIEATRASLSRDIDELSDKVSPARVVQRRKEAVKGRFSSTRDKVMGSARQGSGSAGSAVSSAQGAVGDGARRTVDTVEARVEGNPLAAGLVAFGAGMLISALLPASEAEQRAADNLVEAAKEHGAPVVDEAKAVAQDVGSNLGEQAKQAADEVRSTAQDSVQTVKGDASSSAQTVRDDATS
jgi:ElaB/YqjD/DUF883 family membrane-anchored ribosome-binding protein